MIPLISNHITKRISLTTPSVGVWSHTGPQALPVGVYNDTATGGNSLELSSKTEDTAYG